MIVNDPIVNEFEKQILPLVRKKFKPEKIILFGSRINGTAREDSDLDVVMVSEVFSEIPFIKRMAMVAKQVRSSRHIDYLCYSNKELERLSNTSSIVMDALRTGIEV